MATNEVISYHISYHITWYHNPAFQEPQATGWPKLTPLPNEHLFEPGVQCWDGCSNYYHYLLRTLLITSQLPSPRRLFFHGIDLAQLADGIRTQGSLKIPEKLSGKYSSLEIVYLPAIRR